MEIKISTSLFENILKTIEVLPFKKISSDERKETLEAISVASKETENFFYLKGNRKIERNIAISDLWIKAGIIVQRVFPDENIGIWLQNKGMAYLNPELWTKEELEANKMQIKQIMEAINELLKKKYI